MSDVWFGTQPAREPWHLQPKLVEVTLAGGETALAWAAGPENSGRWHHLAERWAEKQPIWSSPVVAPLVRDWDYRAHSTLRADS